MTDRSPSDLDIGRTIDAWLGLGPTELSDRAIARARMEIHRTRRRASWRRAWAIAIRRRSTQSVSIAIAVTAVVVLAIGAPFWTTSSVGGPETSPTLLRSDGTSPAASPSPQPTAEGSSILPADGAPLFPGTYTTTHLQPGLGLTIDQEVKLNCAPGYQCRGTVDVNQPGWIDLEFGVADGSEMIVIRLDKVFDPHSPTKLIDPPQDLVAWIDALPGKARFAPPKAITVGGLSALQFDVRVPGDKQFGQILGTGGQQAGIGPNGLRVILLRVRGHLVLISEWLGSKNTSRDAAATLLSLQPLVNSITWS